MKILFALILITFSAKSQQDYWLIPSRFFPGIEENIEVATKTGSNLEGRKIENTELRYNHQGPKASKISNENGVLTVKFIEEGTHIISSETTVESLTMNLETFKIYLEENLINLNLAKKEARYNVKQVKNSQILIQVGTKNTTITEYKTGQKIEIIPMSNPYQTTGSISFQVLFNNEPLSGVTIQHLQKTKDGSSILGEHTNKNGTASFSLTRGIHMLKVIYLQPGSNDTEFESYAATLTIGKK